jgi:hypothetical protein
VFVWNEAEMNKLTYAKDTKDASGNYTKGFYFDAVRIYELMGVGDGTAEQALKAYRSDKEAYPHIKEIRDIKTGDPDTLCRALPAYSDSAKAYFTN